MLFRSPADVVVATSSTGGTDVSSTTSVPDTGEMKQAYLEFCAKRGLMDSLDDEKNNAMRLTRKYAWREWKMLDYDDYAEGSDFCIYMKRKAKIPMIGSFHELWWKSVKAHINRSMQNLRSWTTQGIRDNFMSKLNTCEC